MSARARKIDPCNAASAATDDPVDLDTARAIGVALAATTKPAIIAKMPLAACLGRVLAQDVVAPRPLPAFNTAAMDGYAIRCSDLSRGAPFRLRITRPLQAGGGADIMPVHVPGSALRIMTGAAVPAYCDAVIPMEVVTERGGLIDIADCPAPFANIRRQGSVAGEGTVLMQAGRCLTARDIALLAATGHGHLAIRRKLRVAVVSNGAELVEADGEAKGDRIPDSNRPLLLADLSRPWIETRDLGIVGDDTALLSQILDVASEDTRIVVTTGGAARGDADCLRPAIERLGGEILVSRIAMKPGRPTLVARLGSTIVLGLSGNPVAAHIGMQVLGWPILRAAAGLEQAGAACEQGIANFAHTPRPGRSEFPLVRVAGRDAQGRALLDMPARFDAAGLTRLARFDGYATIGAGAGAIERGDAVTWTRL